MGLIEEKVSNSELSKPEPDDFSSFLCKPFGRIPARLVLYFLSFSGFVVSFIMRSDINITILAMVKESKPANLFNSSGQHCHTLQDQANATDSITDNEGTLDWSPKVQSYILTSFLWTYIITQIIGGEVTRRYGTKRVFGYSQLAMSLCSLCIPWASELHYSVVIILRLIQGFFSGFTWPAMFSLIGYWIPLQERTRFISSFQGFNIGTGAAYALCGFIIANFGWKYVFYTTGSIGLMWCMLWYFLAFDSPEIHPRISLCEKEYIRKNTSTTFSSGRNHKAPWGSILRSVPVWVISIACFGRVWVFSTFNIYGPQYMKSILGFNIKENGVISGLPFMMSYVSTLIFSYAADKMIANRWLSMTHTRKLFTGISQILPGLLCILMGYLGCNITAILVVWFFAVILLTAGFAGAVANIADISPNCGGYILGIAQTVMMPAGILSPLTAAYLTEDGHTLSAWRQIFNVTGGVSIGCFVAYFIWTTSEIQHWNSVETFAQPDEARTMLQKDKMKITEAKISKDEGNCKK